MGNEEKKQDEGRSWFVTVNEKSMNKAGLTEVQYKNPEVVADTFIKLWEGSGKNRSAAAAVCVSAQGLYHMHMALYGNTTTKKRVADILFQSHVEKVKCKALLMDYMTKEGKFSDKREKVLYTVNLELIEQDQGKRSDLEAIEELLNNGATPREIFETSFRYRKYANMIRDAYSDRRIKETPLEKNIWCEFHWGHPGSGKSHTYIKMCEKYGEDQVYYCSDYNNAGASGGGFDFYMDNPTKYLFLDELREGSFPFTTLLKILDKYSRTQIHCRGSHANCYCLWDYVVCASVYSPEQLYSFMVDDTKKSIDSIQQLLRRLNIIVYHYINKDGKYREFSMPACDYVSGSDMIRKAMEFERDHSADIDALEALEASDNSCDQNGTIEDILAEFGAVEVTEK